MKNPLNKKHHKKTIGRTYIQYFLSYLIIFTVLIAGFFFILRNQITQRYFRQLTVQAQEQLDSIALQFSDDIMYLSSVDNSIASNASLLSARYEAEENYQLTIYTELQKYASSTKSINSIIYLSKTSDTLISTRYPMEYRDGMFYFLKTGEPSLAFDIFSYYGTSFDQLIYLSGGSMEELIYLPSGSPDSNYLFFYTLDISDIRQQFAGIVSPGLPSIALVDADGQVAVSTGDPAIASYLKHIPLSEGVYELDDSNSLCVRTGIPGGFSVVALISNDALLHQINTAFANSYVMLLLLGILGFLLVLAAMRITYVPLHHLTKKLVSDADPHNSHLELLDQAFSSATEQNKLLQDKLDHYQLSMKKSLLNSVVFSSYSKDPALVPNIDQFFDMKANNEFFVLCIKTEDKPLSDSQLQQFFLTMLPGDDSCIVLSADQQQAVFLVNYTGPEQHKDKVLKELLVNLHEEKGYLGAVSSGSNSPMDIPSLYENALAASSHWPLQPVAAYDALSRADVSLTYPHDKLDHLAECLKETDFTGADHLVDELFTSIDRIATTGSDLPDFLIRCILVDMLVTIIKAINQTGSKFKSYSDLFFETIYFCRSYPYQEKAAEIYQRTKQLLKLCQQETDNRVVTPAQMRQRMESSYCDPDFSIALMADSFHVSIAYMSYLFKKELNINFSDYLWELRLKKAQDLLLTTDMSIDEVSVAVGYLTPSSFRRKFKQETGLTPLQYRTGQKTEG